MRVINPLVRLVVNLFCLRCRQRLLGVGFLDQTVTDVGLSFVVQGVPQRPAGNVIWVTAGVVALVVYLILRAGKLVDTFHHILFGQAELQHAIEGAHRFCGCFALRVREIQRLLSGGVSDYIGFACSSENESRIDHSLRPIVQCFVEAVRRGVIPASAVVPVVMGAQSSGIPPCAADCWNRAVRCNRIGVFDCIVPERTAVLASQRQGTFNRFGCDSSIIR